jgi:plastocyanin
LIVASALGCAEPWPTAIRDPGYSPTPSAPATATVTAETVLDGVGGFGFLFRPPLAPVAVGGNVIFRNETGVDHNVTMDGVSHAIAPGAVFVRTFNAAGTYAFTCTLHEGMSGSVSAVVP